MQHVFDEENRIRGYNSTFILNNGGVHHFENRQKIFSFSDRTAL
jgi:hypothetical protein